MKKIIKIFTSLASVSGVLLLSASVATAQLTNPVLQGALTTDADEATSGQSFATYFVSLWKAIMGIGGLLVLIFFIWGALEWITSGGEKGKLENARNRITQSIVGLIILIGSFAILGFIGQIFFGEDFSLLEITFPNVLE